MKDTNKIERKVKYKGKLDLAGFELPCFVLEDGIRVLSSRGMQDALKMVDENGEQERGPRLKRYLDQKSLQSFIYRDKNPAHFDPIICYDGKNEIHGYEATRLVDFCDGMLEARKNIHLSPRQKTIADQCEILLRSFAKVGIIALVDEATGYQYEREQAELQAILKAFISEEILKWQKTFPWTFYKEIFRLWGLPFTVENIKRPGFVGTLTNELVYKNMPKGTIVLDKLKEKTPKTKGGNYRYRFHQSLTPEIGREELKKVIYTVEALASISQDREEFLALMKRKYSSSKELAEVSQTDFEQKVRILAKTPPLKLKDLKEELRKERKK
ncbi:P63C domain-containing protein [endosymbiont GvMRE of Glomus versiforme]|uniref:P63C domain-containing protein n=1 Tax=endosymbiont GvMRE of Glomus versiforme TaxID=2039283 RepID=UPI000EDC0B11|nr:P63C domain-containing protein [endosymbiont GvMRE of Glomus versiforme]RHZ37313.1 p63C domain protein [endosymbiont GvMRE of Glomus versiforme]RHZ37495.1 p63C domain protein [endosymbiont GvMRE of Glomus versiforme]